MNGKLTRAQMWALIGLLANRGGMSPSQLGQHMSERRGIGRKGSAKLTHAQGYGRLGAYMASLLRRQGWATSTPAHRNGPTYTLTRITDLGRAALKQGEPM